MTEHIDALPADAARPATMTDRAMLERAIIERREAAVELSECEARITNARTFDAAVESEASKANDLRDAAAKRAVEAIGRGEAPPDESGEIAKAVAALEERRAITQKTVRLLSAEVEAARFSHARAHRRVEERSMAIIIARATSQAGRVARLYAELLGEADLLSAFTSLWINGAPIRLPPSVIRVKQIIDGIDDRFDPGLHSGAITAKSVAKRRFADRLKRWQEELIRDADATLDD
jgi:hypothetical protein